MYWYEIMIDSMRSKEDSRIWKAKELKIIDLVAYATELADYGFNEDEILEQLKKGDS